VGSSRTKKKPSNHQKLFSSFAGSCEHFQHFGIHSNISTKNVIEKLQRIAKEKEAPKSEHKQRQEEETKIIEKKKNMELIIVEHEGMLNI